MARKKKDKGDSFEECSASSFTADVVLPPLAGQFPFLDIKRGTIEEKIHTKNNKIFKEKEENKKQTSGQKDIKPHYEGHRQRLRQRFLNNSGQSMPDYEFLELLLFRSVPRKDTKPLAKALLAQFGSFGEVLAADICRLRQVEGCGEAVAADIKIIGAAAGRMLRSNLPKRNIFTRWEDLIAYCQSTMAFEKREQFRVLFLDKKNGLIADEVLQTGTVDHTPVYPRDVLKRVLELAASALILVHNHPSGDPTPSRQDIAMTTKLKEIATALNITIHDHLIIGRNGYSSFRELGLL